VCFTIHDCLGPWFGDLGGIRGEARHFECSREEVTCVVHIMKLREEILQFWRVFVSSCQIYPGSRLPVKVSIARRRYMPDRPGRGRIQ
jgi:hypothetical protein